MPGFFDTRRGKVSLGLAILSGGGMLLTQAMQKFTDPSVQSALHMVLVFWVIFMGRLTYTFGWCQQEVQQGDGSAGVPVAIKAVAPKRKPAADKATLAPNSESEGEDSDAAAGKPRRRRTRRD